MKKLKTPAQRPRKAPSNQTGGTAWGKKLAAEISRMAQAADMKKLILLNFPYIIAFYMVEKAAWLYRHCNGDSVVDRLMVLFMNFGLGTSNAAAGMVLLMLPEFFFALYEKNGMHLETILTNFISVRFKRPVVRCYEVENLYDRELEIVAPIQKKGGILGKK